ncbi:hypothetical protein Pint_34996 [Pistacia integerrima]|uniref:Uncharacterized protein n=1 Tax=Pistacia integerrima TaxID=434235 RepID=A0ACC0Y5B4_9ROSI|nr:hypothetical protein Pint_34996 [Pistacia integerrima]
MAHSRSTHPPVANPFSIISPQFCAHTYPVQLAIVRKVKTITDGNFVVQDINGNILFKLKAADSIFHDRHVLIDAYGNPIVTLRDKIRSIHERWQVFRGESIESSALIFSAKRASLFQSKHNVNVFLAKNTEESLCNFRIRGNWPERSSVIYAGESSTIVAKLHKNCTAPRILIGKERFMVTVYPNMDYAFIIALIVILDAINSEDDDEDYYESSFLQNVSQMVDVAGNVSQMVDVAGNVSQMVDAAGNVTQMVDVAENLNQMVDGEDVADDNDDEDYEDYDI